MGEETDISIGPATDIYVERLQRLTPIALMWGVMESGGEGDHTTRAGGGAHVPAGGPAVAPGTARLPASGPMDESVRPRGRVGAFPFRAECSTCYQLIVDMLCAPP